jgi:ornithine decarboxylase
VRPFAELAKTLNTEFDRLFGPEIEIIAEPGRFMVATAATLLVSIIGKAVRNGKQSYYVNDGVYGSFSGVLFDHCQYHFKAFRKAKNGATEIASVFGPTCDALDVISVAEELPVDLQLGDLLYSENIGAYSIASGTNFNGMPLPQVVAIG